MKISNTGLIWFFILQAIQFFLSISGELPTALSFYVLLNLITLSIVLVMDTDNHDDANVGEGEQDG